MDTTDRPTFAKAMDRLFSIYGGEITTNMRDAWWGALSQFPLGHVLAGMDAHAKDPDNGRFRPTPAHVIGGIERAINAHRSLLAKLREGRAPEIERLEEELYRAKHDMDMGKVDADWARAVIARCRDALAMIDQQLQAEGTILRSRTLGDVNDQDTNHAARKLRIARQ